MKFLDATLPTPAENLACDEALLDLCDEEGEEILRLWESRQHFVVVGYGNHIETEVNVEECQHRGVPILRRCSGGGTVVQGPGCLNYAVTSRVPSAGPLTTVTHANEFVMERNRAAFERLLGTKVSIQGYSDLAFRDGGSWLKFSGNAQRRRRGALIFHGTILHAFQLKLMEELLRFPSAQPGYRAGRRHAEFVANISARREAMGAALRAAWDAREPFVALPSQRIAQLRREHYENDDWTWRRAH